MVVDLNRDYLKIELVDTRMGVMLNLSQTIGGFERRGDILLDEDELKDVIKFCVEEGFLDWDCSECPIQ